MSSDEYMLIYQYRKFYCKVLVRGPLSYKATADALRRDLVKRFPHSEGFSYEKSETTESGVTFETKYKREELYA